MLPFSYQVKRINIGGVVNIFSWRRIQINCKIFREIFLIHTHKLPSRKVFSTRSVSTTTSATASAMGEWRPQADSARQTGLESTIQRSSDCSGKWICGGDKNSRNLPKSAPTLLVAQQPDALWINGDDRQIQRVKLV